MVSCWLDRTWGWFAVTLAGPLLVSRWTLRSVLQDSEDSAQLEGKGQERGFWETGALKAVRIFSLPWLRANSASPLPAGGLPVPQASQAQGINSR